MIGLIDYGVGNLSAFENALGRARISCRRIKRPSDFSGCERLILPGVGAFDHVMGLLNASGMRPELERLVQDELVPVLGVCVGMQILGDSSDEGVESGLGWIPGSVRSLRGITDLPVPHIGWNAVRVPANRTPLIHSSDLFESDAEFYFLHSYFFDASTPTDVLGETEQGRVFPSVVGRANVVGVQFHPEKSHQNGAALLQRFCLA